MTPESLAPSTPGRTRWLAAVGLSVAITGLHCWLWFHAGAFCGDEVNVINLAGTHSLTYMTRDSFPVLLPVMVAGWNAVGLAGSDFSLRLLGLLIGVGTLGALWLPVGIARRAPPLVGLILFGLNGLAIYWTDYLRAYGIGSLLILLTLAAMCHLLERPTWSRTLLLTLAAVLSVQALFPNTVFFAAIGTGGWLVCCLRKDKATAVKIFVAALGGVIAFLPYVASIFRWQQATTIRPGFSYRAALDNLNTMLSFPLPQNVWLWGLSGLAVIVLAGWAMFQPRSSCCSTVPGFTARELQVFAGAVLFLSLVGYGCFLYFAALITSPWYFVPLMALAAACFDIGIVPSTQPRWLRTPFYGVLTALAIISIPFGVRDLNCRFSNMDLVTDRLKKEASPQDYVLVSPWYLGISFNRYNHAGAAWDTLPPVADHSGYRFDLVPASEAELARVTQPVLDRIATTLREGHQIWVVGWMKVPPPGRAATTREGRFLVEHSQSFETVELKIKGQTSDYEDATLLRATGWRETPP